MNTMEQEVAVKINPFIVNASVDWETVAPGLQRKIMSYDNRMMLVKILFEKEAIGTLHHHYHTQISYVESGVFEVEIDNTKKLLSKGDVFHVEPNLVHGVVCKEAGMLVDIFSPMREDFVTANAG